MNGFHVRTAFSQDSSSDISAPQNESACQTNGGSGGSGLDLAWREGFGIARRPDFTEEMVLEGGNATCVDCQEDSPSFLRHYLGQMDIECQHCRALHWAAEKLAKKGENGQAEFSGCCHHGQIQYPENREPMPAELEELLFGNTPEAQHFRENPRRYNSILQLASSKSDFADDRNLSGIQSFVLRGSVHHRIGHMLPEEGEQPKFAQLYCFDTENELENRCSLFHSVRTEVLASLQHMLHRDNRLVQAFKSAFSGLDADSPQVTLEIMSDGSIPQGQHPGTYNQPTTETEVGAVLADEDNAERQPDRAFRVHLRHGPNQYWDIYQTNAIYEPAHFVLTNPRGEHGWYMGIPKKVTKPDGKQNKVTVMQYAAYRMAFRNPQPGQPNSHRDPLHFLGKLFQEWITDTYAMSVMQDMRFHRGNQKQYRRETHQGLCDAISNEENPQGVGSKVYLPATVQGSPRQMMQLYQNALAIVNNCGSPTALTTVTCNTQWREIQDELKKLDPVPKPHDRPDIVARVFKMKLKAILDDILNHDVLGKVAGYAWVVEFQKRGLPHAHILAIMHPDHIPTSPAEVDAFVCAEIPDRYVSLHTVLLVAFTLSMYLLCMFFLFSPKNIFKLGLGANVNPWHICQLIGRLALITSMQVNLLLTVTP